MRELLRDVYFPFGSQYYRAPSPPPEDWERDLDRMAALGFNTVKYWIQWRWNNPAPNQFDFEDIDRLMDLAGERDLRVMLNTIVDVAPAWIYSQYPDASMVTLGGRAIGPQTQPHRQIGGLGLCLHHESVMDHLFDFLGAAVERYSDHPALEIWNVGSEPELTQSMAEMRLWADDARLIHEMLDYNEHAQSAFRRWLKQKRYRGDLDRLNRAWNRNYRSFDEAEVPKTRNTFNDLVDWRMFFVDTLGDHLARRFEVTEKIDAGRHPVMCHHVFIQGFPVTSTASDPWNAGRFGDLHGITQMDDPMMCDVARCCARGRPVISAEMLMLMGYTLDLPDAIDANAIKRNVFTGVAANLKGFIFWQYRPEMLGREAPTWGLSHLDGSTTPWLDAFAEVGRALQQEAGFLLDAAPPAAEVAVLYSPENQVFAWASTGNEKNATDSVLGAHLALYEDNHVVDLIHPREISEGVLDQYKVLVAPFPYWLSADVADRLRAWVEAGGTLIGEAYFGGWDVENGRHHTTLPGYGLHEVFGVRQRNAEPAREDRFLAVSGVVRSDGGTLRSGLNEPRPGDGFVLAQPVDAGGGNGQVEIEIAADLPHLATGEKAYGAFVKETFVVEGAEVMATYRDGDAAVVRHRFGKGQAILVGSYVSLPYRRQGYAGNARLIRSLVDQAKLAARPRVVGGTVRVDSLSTDDGGRMIILQNRENRAFEASIRMPFEVSGEAAELFGGAPLEVSAAEGWSQATLRLGPHDVRVYRV